MNQFALRQAILLPAMPIGLALVAAVVVDRDFWFAVPLAVTLTVVVGAISFLVNREGRWSLHALIGGVVGWVASVFVLMNLQV